MNFDGTTGEKMKKLASRIAATKELIANWVLTADEFRAEVARLHDRAFQVVGKITGNRLREATKAATEKRRAIVAEIMSEEGGTGSSGRTRGSDHTTRQTQHRHEHGILLGTND